MRARDVHRGVTREVMAMPRLGCRRYPVRNWCGGRRYPLQFQLFFQLLSHGISQVSSKLCLQRPRNCSFRSVYPRRLRLSTLETCSMGRRGPMQQHCWRVDWLVVQWDVPESRPVRVLTTTRSWQIAQVAAA